jgi:hypothetical protein
MFNANFKNITKSFIKDFISNCKELNIDKQQVVGNINIISEFKEKCQYYVLVIENELIINGLFLILIMN